MKKETIKLWDQQEYNYELSFGFIPNITNYIHEDDTKRDYVIIVPGGGYGIISPTEGEIVGLEFYNKGYNFGVLTYTTNLLGTAPLNKQPLKDISRAIRLIRNTYKNSKIVVCGFSAGGHLSASIAVHYLDIEDTKYQNTSNRPDACVLSYPVITSGEYTHKGSIINLIGSDAYINPNLKDKLEYYSLEKHITDDTPPCFLWHTVTDGAVPVDNSLLFYDGLRKHNVKSGLHIYSNGGHGLSLSNEKWEQGEFGEPYLFEQTVNVINAVRNDIILLEPDKKATFLEQHKVFEQNGELWDRKAVKEVASWINLAFDWLDEVLQ